MTRTELITIVRQQWPQANYIALRGGNYLWLLDAQGEEDVAESPYSLTVANDCNARSPDDRLLSSGILFYQTRDSLEELADAAILALKG